MDEAGVLVVIFIGFFALMAWIGYASSGDAPDWLSSEQGLAKKQLRETRRTNQLMEEQREREAGRE